VCGFPPEYCEYGGSFAKCKIWISKNCADQFPGISLNGTEEAEVDAEGMLHFVLQCCSILLIL
jgi:hypothetical protein